MNDEVYRQHRNAQDKYVYFLLAAAAAGIGLAVQRTAGSTLNWSMVILGLGVLSWVGSFYCGCQYVQYIQSQLYANAKLIEVSQGKDHSVGGDPKRIAAAASGIRKAMESNDRGLRRWANGQFRLLILGAILFVAWHVAEMAKNTLDKSGTANSQNVAPPATRK